MRTVALAIVMALMVGTPAAAGTAQNPELEDTCGVGPHLVDEQVPPWLDLCGGWFQTTSAGTTPEIKVNLKVADLLAQRPDSQYWVDWHAGGCGFTVQRMDGGAELAPGDAVSRLLVQCKPAVEVECPPPLKQLGFFCFEIEDPLVFDVSDSYAQSGNQMSWTLRFDGALAPYAEHHRDGAVLSAPGAMTAIGLNSAPAIGPGKCTRSDGEPWSCQNHVTDWIPDGRDYVVGA